MSLTSISNAFSTCEYGAGASAGALTITLAAVPNMRHAITCVQLYRSATAALTGTASLTITTTNLPDAFSWVVGNLMVAGGTQIDVDTVFVPPLLSSVVNTATTIVMPAPGTAVLWNGRVFYYLVPGL